MAAGGENVSRSPTGRTIIILSDGTGNSASAVFKTNVWRLYQSLDLSEPLADGRPRQIAFYDDGVGTSAIRPLALLGYANLPLDGLWLRGPYLHNGAVPTLADLLKHPEERPRAFLRGSDVIDSVNGGFQSLACDPSQTHENGFCFDTSLDGNGNGGHLYGVDLPPGDKADLLAYLLTF